MSRPHAAARSGASARYRNALLNNSMAPSGASRRASAASLASRQRQRASA